MTQENKRVYDSEINLIKMLMFIIVLLLGIYFAKSTTVIKFDSRVINDFSTIFLSIIFEGIPFILIGALASSIIQIFVSEEAIAKIIPKNKFVGVLIASLVGLVFPVCECAIVPITRRLIKKGVPLSIAVTFMLSVPIMNPVVLLSTHYAFMGMSYMVIARAMFGMIGAITIGVLIGILNKDSPFKRQLVKKPRVKPHKEGCDCGEHNAHSFKNTNAIKHNHIPIYKNNGSCSCGHSHNTSNNSNKLIRNIEEIISHTSAELYDIGRFFIMGVFLSTCMQVFIPKELILSIGGGVLSSIIVMMVLAFVLSVCSETDAFIARSFLGQFTNGSIIGFLILGPMLDIKNTIMLCGSFKLSFVAKLIFLIVTICFILAVIANILPLAALSNTFSLGV
ncbi:permease [Clostridium estertheticum]|uniref:permease n=1 Tax=Clostridium estertheticum TaxID=238834 RepID=UPI001CD08070|nr:permease [Clostridium estertheticum]MBZ9688957.1 permease [Clostridium estertheticum]